MPERVHAVPVTDIGKPGRDEPGQPHDHVERPVFVRHAAQLGHEQIDRLELLSVPLAPGQRHRDEPILLQVGIDLL
jgi:hypothetical protein